MNVMMRTGMNSQRIYWGRGKLKKKAEEKLINDISEGKENAPEECYDSDATVTEILSE